MTTNIKTVLNSSFTFKDWLKQKIDDSLVKKTGTVGYVPSAVKKLGKPCLEVFKQLRYGKSDDFICKKLSLDLDSYYEHYDQTLLPYERIISLPFYVQLRGSI